MLPDDRSPSQELIEKLQTDGFAVLRDVVPSELTDALRRAVERAQHVAETPFGTNNFLGTSTRRVFNLLSRDPIFARVPLHPPVLEVADAVLGSDLLLSSLTAIDIHPSQAAQPLHADDASLPIPRPHPPVAVVGIWALTDFTIENGGTRVVPGSHRADRRPHSNDDVETVATQMTAGSVLIYNGSLWHGGGANNTDERRMGIVCNYYAGWLRQEECQLLALNRDQVAAFPPRLRRMIGYGTFRGLHGHVDGVDPGTWFDPSVESQMVWDRIR